MGTVCLATGRRIPEGGQLLLPLQGARSLCRKPQPQAHWSDAGILLPGSPWTGLLSPGLHAWRGLCWNAPVTGAHCLPGSPGSQTLRQSQKGSQTLSLPAHSAEEKLTPGKAAGPRSFKAGLSWASAQVSDPPQGLCCFFKSSPENTFCFVYRERKRERERDWCVRETSIG